MFSKHSMAHLNNEVQENDIALIALLEHHQCHRPSLMVFEKYELE